MKRIGEKILELETYPKELKSVLPNELEEYKKQF